MDHASEIRIDEVRGHDLERANRIYAAVDFAPSESQRDRTFAAWSVGEIVALGRIVRYDDRAVEIGGFWTQPRHRGHGIAGRVLDHVIAQLPANQVCYCIPFAHRSPLYRSRGFVDVANRDELPASIRSKLEFCERHVESGRYAPVTVLSMRR